MLRTLSPKHRRGETFRSDSLRSRGSCRKDRGWEGLEGTLDEGGLLRIAWWGRKLRMAIPIQKSPSRIKIYQQPRESSFPWLFQLHLLKSVLCPIVGLKWVPRCVWRSGYPPSPQPTPAPHRKSDTGGSLEKKNAWMILWFHICVSRALPTRLLKRILRFYKNRSLPPKKRKPPKSLQCSLLVFKQR